MSYQYPIGIQQYPQYSEVPQQPYPNVPQYPSQAPIGFYPSMPQASGYGPPPSYTQSIQASAYMPQGPYAPGYGPSNTFIPPNGASQPHYGHTSIKTETREVINQPNYGNCYGSPNQTTFITKTCEQASYGPQAPYAPRYSSPTPYMPPSYANTQPIYGHTTVITKSQEIHTQNKKGHHGIGTTIGAAAAGIAIGAVAGAVLGHHDHHKKHHH